MSDVSPEVINGWIEAVAVLHEQTVRSEDAQEASTAAASAWSGSGYLDAPAEVMEMLTQAVEIGYATALDDLRSGRLDDAIREWRPELDD
ncbi:hypothetical protein [Pseudonocardia sp. GCM10023141]|uniref:hypothetical protein n=1 Tax=Pseudonocardia sp. GCM10023141 TaxID=3252653 RepID=UPI00360A5F02